MKKHNNKVEQTYGTTLKRTNTLLHGVKYGTSETIDSMLSYYIDSVSADFNNPVNCYVHQSKISSSGRYIPKVFNVIAESISRFKGYRTQA